MITTTPSAAVADPASSHRDDPGTPNNRSERHPEDGPGDAGSADAEPPEPAGRDDSGSEITIDIADDVAHEIDLLWLDGQLLNIAAHLPQPIERVSIRIVGDSEMTALNRRFHAADDTTDVLTFYDSENGDSVNADLALCADEASRQASSRGKAVERELLLYALHGLLHCCGFEDTDDESFATMHAEEDRILIAIGVGATFADDSDDARTREQRP